jgi:hypothetical protein
MRSPVVEWLVLGCSTAAIGVAAPRTALPDTVVLRAWPTARRVLRRQQLLVAIVFFPLSVLSASTGGLLLGMAVAQLVVAARLRNWEVAHHRRLLRAA